MNNIREELARLEHERWSKWMEYMFSKGEFNPDGTWTMPTWAVERWHRQSITPYSKLSEKEKDSDRAEIDIFIQLINSYPNKLLTEDEKIKYCALLEDCIKQDPETGHGIADDILTDILKTMGYIEIIALYDQVDKWYA